MGERGVLKMHIRRPNRGVNVMHTDTPLTGHSAEHQPPVVASLTSSPSSYVIPPSPVMPPSGETGPPHPNVEAPPHLNIEQLLHEVVPRASASTKVKEVFGEEIQGDADSIGEDGIQQEDDWQK